MEAAVEESTTTAPDSAGSSAPTRGSPSPPGSSRPGPPAAAAAALAELGRVLDASKALVSELETLVAFTNPDGEFVKTLGQAKASGHIWKALFQLPVDEDE